MQNEQHTDENGTDEVIVLGYTTIDARIPKRQAPGPNDSDTNLLARVATSLRELP